MSELLDRAVPVRAGEGIDEEALGRYLTQQLPGLVTPLTITQFPGGASNLTYLVESGDREWVLRRPPPGARHKAAHDVLREARIMRALKPEFPFVPRVDVLCEDTAIIGTEFYLMERLRGVILRRDLPGGLALSPEQARALCHAVLDCLVRLHGVDVQAAGLSGFGRGEGYVKRQIEGWAEWFAKAHTDDVPDYAEVIRWLRANMPASESRICLIHNDFRFDNVVLDASQGLVPIGVLDWEMATLGDPLMDLGASLAYWIEADDPPELRAMRRQPTHLPGMLTRREVVAYYRQATGSSIQDMTFYEVYGLFRLAGIGQQIYARYRKGEAKNPEFERFGDIVRYLESRALGLMAGGAA
jgi:aminoglycoside phosphotransferase (APT) family kinase protein